MQPRHLSLELRLLRGPGSAGRLVAIGSCLSGHTGTDILAKDTPVFPSAPRVVHAAAASSFPGHGVVLRLVATPVQDLDAGQKGGVKHGHPDIWSDHKPIYDMCMFVRYSEQGITAQQGREEILKKRLGRSPDLADALIMSFAIND